MRKRNKIKEAEIVVLNENKIKEEIEMTEQTKVGFFKGIFNAVKGFVTSKAGKTTAVVGAILVGVTAAGVLIYKLVFEDGTEELITSDGSEVPEEFVAEEETTEASEDEAESN